MNKRLTTEQIEAIRQRAEKATEGPWIYEFAHGINISVDAATSIEVVTDDTGVVRYPDADFIAHAREDIPALLAEVERLREELHSTVECIDDYYENETDDIPVHDILDAIRDGAYMTLYGGDSE